MSGAGKSTVLDALEDMGWDCVENLPASMLKDYAEQGLEGGRHVPIAVGMDVRSRGFDPAALPDIVQSIEGVSPEILYLDCSGAELIRRYDETRRLHPLAPDRPAEDGIARERTFTARLRSEADSVLDTTDLTPAELRDELRRRYGGRDDGPHRGASHRLDSPLLGRRQNLSDRRIRLHRRAPSLRLCRSRNGGTIAKSGLFSECPAPRPGVAAERHCRRKCRARPRWRRV